MTTKTILRCASWETNPLIRSVEETGDAKWCLLEVFEFIIYLQKIPLDTTYFPTQKYKTLYHASNVIFSLSPSYIFYPPRKNPAPVGSF